LKARILLIIDHQDDIARNPTMSRFKTLTWLD